MRFPRVSGYVLVTVLAVFLLPGVAFASGGEVSAPDRLDVDLLEGIVPCMAECPELANIADEAWQEWHQAERTEDAVCAVYGLFSGECVAAVIYAEYKEYQWNQAAADFFECHDAQAQ